MGFHRADFTRNFTGNGFFFITLIALGSIFFLWFLWPAVFKGMLNAGNVCGMLGCMAAVFYGIWHNAVHRLVIKLWQFKPARACLILSVVLAAAAIVLLAAAAVSIIRASSKSIPKDTPAVVLGCSVKGTSPISANLTKQSW